MERANILIIDDEHAIAQMTSLILKKRGYEITSCASAEEALEILNTFKPDLIILDNLLGGKTGLKFCHEIKSDSATSSVPILITTGQKFNLKNLSAEQKFLKPDDILTKPFEIEDLIKKVQKLIK